MRERDGYQELVPGVPGVPGVPEGGQEKVVIQLGWSQSIVIPQFHFLCINVCWLTVEGDGGFKKQNC